MAFGVVSASVGLSISTIVRRNEPGRFDAAAEVWDITGIKIRLDEIDWRTGTLVVYGKSQPGRAVAVPA